MVDCGHTGYRFWRNLCIFWQSSKLHCPCSASNNCVRLHRTFSVGPDVLRLDGNERCKMLCSEDDGMTIFLRNLRENFLFVSPSCRRQIRNRSCQLALPLLYSSCRWPVRFWRFLRLEECCQSVAVHRLELMFLCSWHQLYVYLLLCLVTSIASIERSSSSGLRSSPVICRRDSTSPARCLVRRTTWTT